MSTIAGSLRLRVRIPSKAWKSVCRECCTLFCRCLCVGLITLPEESYRVWCDSNGHGIGEERGKYWKGTVHAHLEKVLGRNQLLRHSTVVGTVHVTSRVELRWFTRLFVVVYVCLILVGTSPLCCWRNLCELPLDSRREWPVNVADVLLSKWRASSCTITYILLTFGVE